MLKEMSFMIQRFPDHKEKILSMYTSNQDFRHLCNDYCTCITMLEALKESVSEDQQAKTDYEKVSAELEQELLATFEKT